MCTTPGLRVVRNGIGIARSLSLKIPGLLGLWSMTVAQTIAANGAGGAAMDVDSADARRVLLVLGLTDRTILLGWSEPAGDEVGVGEVRPPGWRLDEQTLAAGATRGGQFAIQVTPAAVVLLDAAGWETVSQWAPSDIGGASIGVASIAGDQVAVVVDGATVVYLELRQGALVRVSHRQLDNAVSCIDVHSWLGDAGPAAHVAVGLWGANDVCLLTLPELLPNAGRLSVGMPQGTLPQEHAMEAAPASGEAGDSAQRSSSSDMGSPPRSVLMCTLGGTSYLLVGLGDGRLHQFALHVEPAGAIVREHKCITLGTGPLVLTPFDNSGAPSVFAAGDHSAVLFADRHRAGAGAEAAINDHRRVSKLIYANVDVRGIQRMAPIVSTGFPSALCLAVDDQLWVGSADPVQQLHVRNCALPQWAVPHRIAYSQTMAVYGVATIHALDRGGALSSAAGDVGAWERLALMETNEQQARLIGDVRAQVVLTPPVEAGRFSVMAGQGMGVLASVLLRPFEMPESLCVAQLECLVRPQTDATAAADLAAGAGNGNAAWDTDVRSALGDVFLLGTSIVLPGEDDAKRGRIIAARWDGALEQMQIVGSLAVMGAVYALAPFRGMLLAAVGNRLLLVGWQRRAVGARAAGPTRRVCDGVVYADDPDYELVAMCSQQTQVTALSLAVAGDYVAVGDIMSSVSQYRYEEYRVPPPRDASAGGQQQQQQHPGLAASQIRRRLVPVARDYSGVWTTAVATVPAPLASNRARLRLEPVEGETGFLARQEGDGSRDLAKAFRDPAQERLVVADSYGNLIRMARADGRAGGDEERLYVEGRWHLGDMVNVIRPGSLVMDIPDPEFPGLFRPQLVYGTLHGAIGVVASVEDGKLGRVLDRLQTNMAHLLPVAGLWDYGQWRGYSSDQRSTGAFGFLDGDLIEQFLDLSPETQQLVFSGGGALADRELVEAAEHDRKSEYWASHARIEAEGDVAVLAQMAVSDIGRREGLALDYVVRLVESLARLH
ncbi:DNA damage-binding protein 1 [Coemansia biformis]|uniref:DNA damage-binding protein 1 n=1 Tax=Coemansia biformis TaxID=1286918 RepID=A0A9W8CWV9_9FUNG|nr:DNA damage-binding protein 1 [Coemansia biformis]